MSHISASEKREFVPVRIAVLTVSDTRKLEDDRSGDTLVKRIEGAGHLLVARDIVRDERGTLMVLEDNARTPYMRERTRKW